MRSAHVIRGLRHDQMQSNGDDVVESVRGTCPVVDTFLR